MPRSRSSSTGGHTDIHSALSVVPGSSVPRTRTPPPAVAVLPRRVSDLEIGSSLWFECSFCRSHCILHARAALGVERSVLPMVVPTIELVELIGESEAWVVLQPMPLLRGSRRLGDTATRFTLLVALPCDILNVSLCCSVMTFLEHSRARGSTMCMIVQELVSVTLDVSAQHNFCTTR